MGAKLLTPEDFIREGEELIRKGQMLIQYGESLTDRPEKREPNNKDSAYMQNLKRNLLTKQYMGEEAGQADTPLGRYARGGEWMPPRQLIL